MLSENKPVTKGQIAYGHTARVASSHQIPTDREGYDVCERQGVGARGDSIQWLIGFLC